MSDLRLLPSVEQLLQMEAAIEFSMGYGRPLTLEAVRAALAEVRTAGGPIPSRDDLLARTGVLLAEWTRVSLVKVINASGVILHTNLGRAPLSQAAALAMVAAATGYSTLEYDLDKGARGSRSVHAEQVLRRLTGAEAALVVNNNAAAVLLTLTALANRKRAIIARSQLVEIGGGFRVPDVMSQSGARLIEVGTTNQVHLEDYARALEQPAGVVLRAHSSNFRIIGFTSQPGLSELADLAHQHGVPLVDDLGSGALLDTARFGLAHEPTVQESLAAGCDLVCFSGDKLLGGPQAGIILGRADLLAKIRRHPLARAVRADKLCLAALAATLLHYLKDEAVTAVPVWRMIATPIEQIEKRACAWAAALSIGGVKMSRSTVGGGSLPEETLPTYVLALKVPQPNRFMARLRGLYPPIIARVEADEVVLDARTVLPEEEAALLAGLRSLLN